MLYADGWRTSQAVVRPRADAVVARSLGWAVLVVMLASGGCSTPAERGDEAAAKAARDARQAAQSEARQPARAKPKIPTTSEQRAQQALDRGLEAQATGDIDAALAEFERAIAVNPELTTAYIRAGDVYRDRSDFANAELRYGQAAQIEPRNFDAQYLHGLVLQLMNRLDEAVRAYLRALAVRPESFEANMNLGTSYLQMGEPDQALAYSQRAVRVNPNSGPARVNLGAVYAELDQHAEAVVEFQQAAELLPEPDDKLLLNMAESLGRLDRYAEMSATLDQLIRVAPSAVAFERLGSALFRQRDYAASLDAFERSLGYDPTYYPALNGVAVCQLNNYLWSGKTDRAALTQAVEALRKSLQAEGRQPQIVELLRRYGRAGASGADE
jgi:tetratricopeptide (TPR) repeat protein